MYTETLFEAINEIDSVQSECAMDTMVAMYDSYSKANVILENYEGDNLDAFSVFQEGEISDRMKESGKKYGTLMKILTFIPRLIGAIIDMFKNKIAKKSKSSKVCRMKPKQRNTFLKAIDPRTSKAARVALISTLLTATAATTGGVIYHNHKKDADEEADNLSSIERGLNLIDQSINDSSIDEDRKKYISSDVKRMRDMISIVRNENTKNADRKIALDDLNDAPDRIEKYITELKAVLPTEENDSPKNDTNDDSTENTESVSTSEHNDSKEQKNVEKKAEQIVEQIDDKNNELNKKALAIYNKLQSFGFSSNKRIMKDGSYFNFIFDEETNRIDVYVECIEQIPIRLSNEIQVVSEAVNALVNRRFKKMSDAEIDNFIKKQTERLSIASNKISSPGYGKTEIKMYIGSLDDEKNRATLEKEQIHRMAIIAGEINNWNTIMEKYKKECDKLENFKEPIPAKIKTFIDERTKSIDKLRECFTTYAGFFNDCIKAVDEIYNVLGYEKKQNPPRVDIKNIG